MALPYVKLQCCLDITATVCIDSNDSLWSDVSGATVGDFFRTFGSGSVSNLCLEVIETGVGTCTANRVMNTNVTSLIDVLTDCNDPTCDTEITCSTALDTPPTPTPTPTPTPSITPTNTPTPTQTPVASSTPTVTPSTSVTPSITPSGCDCKYQTITISINDINNSFGNTDPDKDDGTVYVSYSGCGGSTVTKKYTAAGTYTNDICVDVTQLDRTDVYFYANNLKTAGDSTFTNTDICCSEVVTPTPTPTVTSTVTPTITPTISVTPTVTPTITPTTSVTPTVTPTTSVSPTVTPTITQTTSVSPTVTPTVTQTTSVTPTVTPTTSVTQTPGVSPTATPTITPTITSTPEPTPSITPTQSVTPTAGCKCIQVDTNIPFSATGNTSNPNGVVEIDYYNCDNNLVTFSATTAVVSSGVFYLCTHDGVVEEARTWQNDVLYTANTFNFSPYDNNGWRPFGGSVIGMNYATYGVCTGEPCGPNVTPTPTSSVTPTTTPTPTVTPTITNTPGVSPTPSTTVTPTNTPTQTLSPTITPSVTVTPTITNTPGGSPTPSTTVTPTITPSVTVTPTITPSVTVTPTITNTPGGSPTPSTTATPTVTPTNTPTTSLTPSVTVTPTITNTPTVTATPGSTLTPTPTATPTITPTQSVTPTITPTSTLTPTPSPTPAPVGPCSGDYCVNINIDAYSGYNGTYNYYQDFNGKPSWTGGTIPGYIFYKTGTTASTGWCLSDSYTGTCIASGPISPFCDDDCPDFDNTVIYSGSCTGSTTPNPCSGLTFDAEFYCNETNIDPCYETRWGVVDTSDVTKFTINYYGNIITGTTISSNLILSQTQFNPGRISCPDRGPTNIKVQSIQYAGDYRIEFSEYVENPILQIMSLGDPAKNTTLSADTPFTIYCSAVTDPSYKIDTYDLPGQRVSATEGNGLIQFSGTVSAITLNYSPYEYVTQLMWGIPCQTPDPSPSPTPTPTVTPTLTPTPTPTDSSCVSFGANISVYDATPTPTPSATPTPTPTLVRSVNTGGTVNYVIDDGSFVCFDVKELKDCETGILYYVTENIEYTGSTVTTGTTMQVYLNGNLRCMTYQRDINGSATAYLGEVVEVYPSGCASCALTPTPTPTPTTTLTPTPTPTVTPQETIPLTSNYVFSSCTQNKVIIQTVPPGNMSVNTVTKIDSKCYTYLGQFTNYIPPVGVQSVNTNSVTTTPSNIYDNCTTCATPVPTYYKVVKMDVACREIGVTYLVDLGTGVSAPSIGDYVRLQYTGPIAYQGCFKVTGITTNGPAANTIIKVYNQCDCPDIS